MQLHICNETSLGGGISLHRWNQSRLWQHANIFFFSNLVQFYTTKYLSIPHSERVCSPNLAMLIWHRAGWSDALLTLHLKCLRHHNWWMLRIDNENGTPCFGLPRHHFSIENMWGRRFEDWMKKNFFLGKVLQRIVTTYLDSLARWMQSHCFDNCFRNTNFEQDFAVFRWS